MKSRKTPRGAASVLGAWMFIASLMALVGSAGAVDQALRPLDHKGFTLGGPAEYGKVMAASGDWLAVGAPGQGFNQFRSPVEDPSFYEGGRVLLWKRDGVTSAWELKQVLTWPGVLYSDQRFGARLAMDGNRLLVGDKGASGRIYAYLLSDGVWTADGTLSLGGDAANGFTMSGALALSGDYAAIGSPDAMVNGVKRGGADLFQRQIHGWVRVSRLVQPEPTADVRGMGIFLALNGSTVYASYSTAAPVYGGVLVFEKGTESWGMRNLEGVPQVNHRGIGLQVTGGRLFVVMNSGNADRRILEYTLSTTPGGLETLATELQTNTRDGTWHISGNLMVLLPVASTPWVQVYRRQPSGWQLEEQVDYSTYDLQLSPVAVQVAGTDLLLSGRKRPPGSGIYSHFQPDTVQVLRLVAPMEWGRAASLTPLEAERVRDADFGRSVSASEPWLAVGAPCSFSSANRRPGVVQLYRRGSHGTYQYHSLLQSPEQGSIPVPYLDTAHFGHLVSLSGNLLAVSMPLAVVIYEFQPSSDTWQQAAIILPPAGGPTESFGASMALQGSRLVIGAPNLSSVYIYQIAPGGTVTTEATLQKSGEQDQTFGHSVALDGDRLLIGTPNPLKAAVFVYEKRNSTWTQTARLQDPTTLPPVIGFSSRFGWSVALSGAQALVSSPAGTVPYSLTGTLWRAGKILPGPDSSQEAGRSPVISGNIAAIRLQGLPGLRLFEFSAGLWKPLPQPFPFLGGSRVGLALQSGQLITRAAEFETEVRVLDLNRPPTLSYDALYLASGPNTQMVNAGEFVPDVKVDAFAGVTLHHQGIVTTKVNIEITNSEGEFTLGTNPVILAPGQSKVLDLTFLPLIPGQKQVTLTFTPDTPGAAPQILVIQAQVLSQPTALQFTQVPEARLEPLGSLLEIYATVAGTRPWTYRWLRNGTAIPGASAFYHSVKEPGLYQVQITNPHGTVSTEAVPVGFYGLKSPAYQAVLAGSTVRASVHATGPGVYVRWSMLDEGMLDYEPLADGPAVSGSHTPNLTLRNFRRPLTSLRAAIYLPTGPGTQPLYVEVDSSVEIVTRPEMFIRQAAPLFVGQPGGSNIFTEVYYTGRYATGPVYRFSGLPPGLKASPDGSIDGTPTTPGVYTVSGTFTADGHTSPVATARIVVAKYADLHPGSYWAFMPTSADMPQGGALTLDLTHTGTYSGSLMIGLTRTPLAGALTPSEIEPEVFIRRSKDFAFPILRGGKKQVAFVMDTGYPALGLIVRDAGTEFDIHSYEAFAALEMIKPLVLDPPSPAALGRHNFGLLSRAGEGMGGPPGHGFGTLTVAPDRRVTYAAQLADGTALLGSSWLGWGYVDGQLFFYQGDAKTRSILRGAVPLKGDDNTGHTRNLTWERLPLPGRLYPDGIPPVDVTLLTSRYPAPGGAAALPGTQHQVNLDALNLFVTPTPFQLTAQGRALFTPVTNPLGIVLSVTPATGLYSGSFTLRDPNPVSGKPAYVRKVTVKGILLPELQSGPGYFLLPALPDPDATPPTILSTSPITSGAIVLDPAAGG